MCNFRIDHGRVPLAMVQTMKKLKSGYINGTRVMLGHLGDFLNTSAITDLSFLGSQEDGLPDRMNYFLFQEKTIFFFKYLFAIYENNQQDLIRMCKHI